MKLDISVFEVENIAKDWVDYDVCYAAVMGWYLKHRQSEMALCLSYKKAMQLVKLLDQCSTLKPCLP